MLKVLSSHLNWRAWQGSFDLLLKVRQFFKKFFNDTISREEHKTIYRGLRLSEMTLSNQSHFPQFFMSPESHLIGLLYPFSCSRNWPGPGKSSSGVTKSRKMTYRGLANSGLWQARIGLSPVSHLAKSEKMIWWNQLPKVIFRGQAIPACLKPALVRSQ